LFGLPAGTGKFGLDLKAALRQHPAFRTRGVTPTETTPPSVALDVDDLVSVPARVTVAPPAGVLLQGVPEASPGTATVRLPSRLATRLPEDASVVASIDPAAVSQLLPGRAQTLPTVPLEKPEAIRLDPMAPRFAQIDPPTVAVNLTILSGTATAKLPSVRVSLRVPPREFDRWDVDIAEDEETIADVEVSGPRDIVSQIEQGKVLVFAVVALDWQQLEAAALSGEPVVQEALFMLSTDVGAPVEFKAPDRTVRLTIRRRPNSPGPGSVPPG
jgi:hypothetical protein